MNKPLTLLSALAAAAGLAHAAIAQPPSPPPAEQPPAPSLPTEQTDVSEQDLDTFANIYVELQSTAEEFESRMAGVESQEEAQELQMEMREESLNAIEAEGWSPEKYNQVAEAINSDPDLIEQTMALIDEKS